MTRSRAKLKHIAGRGQYGLNFPASEYVADGVRLIRTTDLAGGHLTAAENGIFVPEEAVSTQHRLSYRDLLLSRSGTIGRAFLVPEEASGMAWAGFLVRYTPTPDTDARFLYYCTQSADFQDAVNADAITSTIQNFNADRYDNLVVPVPLLGEQRAIADYLDQETAQIDALVAKQEELIRRLEERRLAVITATALTGLRHEAAGEHDISRWGSSLAVEPWLSRAPESWGMERFKSVCLPRSERNIAGTEIMLSLTVRGHLVDRASMTIQQNASDSSIPRYFVARPNDLVVNPMWLIGGAIGVSDKRGAVSPDYRVFKINEALYPWYLHAVLRSAPYFDQYKLYTRANTTFDRRIKQNDLDNLPLPIPPLDEQRVIVKHIDEQTSRIDKLITKAEEHIALAKERRSALITAAVTGQFDVRTARKAG
ncbi:restriction endonuclease subunit S [Brevibacterium sp. SIMBA_078]|uniref:restriction endonuclease subunit S n=1 Tax=Brevibacterium sp. SIMBA_078 TaxID=3085816 RepID=UPI00397D7D06